MHIEQMRSLGTLSSCMGTGGGAGASMVETYSLCTYVSEWGLQPRRWMWLLGSFDSGKKRTI